LSRTGYIKDLELSPATKAALSWILQITKVSELEGLNYLTFANIRFILVIGKILFLVFICNKIPI